MVYTTEQYEGLLAETITIQGHNGDFIHTYMARPVGPGPYPGIVLIPHGYGWTEQQKETLRRFAYRGYVGLCPDIWCRSGHGTPEDVLASARADGGLPDDQVIADSAAAAAYIRTLPISNGKVGVIGSCMGGRYTMLSTCRTTGVFDAGVNCWGGNVVQAQDKLTPKQPVSPHEYTKDLSCPLLGLFGNDDQNPNPAEVDILEQELKKFSKQYEFNRYDGAGHGFFYYDRPSYRQEQSNDGWEKVWTFFENHLSTPK